MKLENRIEKVVNTLPPELDNLIDHFFGQCKSSGRRLMPRTDIIETETAFVLSVELPGISADDVSVEVADDQLTVAGEKKLPELEENTTRVHAERVSGKFERQFDFPTQVDFEKISAACENGVLTITAPKSEKVLPRKVEINVK
ncbi:MAG: Hsp20/alpha crystallin family protein [Pirellulaceae bacterium]